MSQWKSKFKTHTINIKMYNEIYLYYKQQVLIPNINSKIIYRIFGK